MIAYQYILGKWFKLKSERVPWDESAIFYDWLEKGNFRRDAPTIFGYGDSQGYGDFQSVKIYQSKRGVAFLAMISPLTDSFFTVYIDDLPSLMMFIKDVALPLDIHAIKSLLEETKQGFAKLFRVQHGQGMDSACYDCDPYEARMEDERCAKLK